jgi:cobalamin biosynthetic protein CobC
VSNLSRLWLQSAACSDCKAAAFAVCTTQSHRNARTDSHERPAVIPVPPRSPDLRKPADHGGGIDAAVQRHGGSRADWLDLSTGINPQPYPLPPLPQDAWTALPDAAAIAALMVAARRFWRVPAEAAILAAPGASALIARIPALVPAEVVHVPGPTYNEHARAFLAAGWALGGPEAGACVLVHPNNPDGRRHSAPEGALCIIDESFCDICPDESLIAEAARPGRLILKSFGKFWGLAGLRLGFAIGDPALIGRLEQMLGPWAVSGPALAIGAAALSDASWAASTRLRLAEDAARLDRLLLRSGARLAGGTPLFRLYEVPSAEIWQTRLARARIWSRIFPYSDSWLRLGLPGSEADWRRIERALE